MSLTVVLRLQARPGLIDALLAAGRVMYQQALRAGTLQSVRVLQGLQDANTVLVLGEWRSRDEYWAAREREQAGDDIVALCAGPPQRCFFERLGYYEDMSQQAVVVAAAFVRATPPAEYGLAEYLMRDAR